MLGKRLNISSFSNVLSLSTPPEDAFAPSKLPPQPSSVSLLKASTSKLPIVFCSMFPVSSLNLNKSTGVKVSIVFGTSFTEIELPGYCFLSALRSLFVLTVGLD